jgi:DNA polymerase-3 subunit epsilon
MSSTSEHTDSVPLSDIHFVVIDVETTGMSASQGRMTEIACVVVRDGEVRHSFSSLMNPRQFIPSFIENLTGITNAMVVNAPEERDVLHEVHKLLQLPNAVFVAHNAAFDVSFVREGLLRHGMDLPTEYVLCTCKLANRLLPKNKKKNLGAVAAHFNVRNDARHRAFGDAQATAHVLIQFLEQLEEEHDAETLLDVVSFQNKRLKNFHTPPRVVKKVQPFLDALPEAPGVYYMHDSDGNVLYVGKAKSLADRVRSYFQMSAHHPEKIARMVRSVHSIRWEETGSELAALLLESKEIKRLKPPANTMSKRLRRYPFLRITTNTDFPVVELCDRIAHDGAEYYGPFLYRGMVYDVIQTIEKNFRLRVCREELSPSETVAPCLYYHIHKCGAPCAMRQSKEEYAAEVQRVRTFLSSYSEGVLAMVEHEMHACAERLEFENAAVLRNRLKELRKVFSDKSASDASLNSTNVVLVIPASEREKSVEVFALRSGFLKKQVIIGRKASLDGLRAELARLYAPVTSAGDQETAPQLTPTLHEIDELRILAQWMYRRRTDATIIHIDDEERTSGFVRLQQTVRSAWSASDEQQEQQEQQDSTAQGSVRSDARRFDGEHQGGSIAEPAETFYVSD